MVEMGKVLSDDFDGNSDKALYVDIFWGVKGLNKEGGSQWDASFIGEAILDEKFDLSEKKAQLSLLKLCEDLSN